MIPSCRISGAAPGFRWSGAPKTAGYPAIGHSSINRWALRFLPLIEKVARKYKPVVGAWMRRTSRCRAHGNTFIVRSTRMEKRSTSCLRQSLMGLRQKHLFDLGMAANGKPDKIVMDKSDASKAAIDAINAGHDVPILVRQIKYRNNIVEQYHRAIQRVITSNCCTCSAKASS